jgi:rhodanese-related sulfurtransferase
VTSLAQSVDRRAVQRLVAAGAQLVEVLPRDEFDDEHLPGALHIPLKSLTPETARVLDPARPVIVYCWDGL